MCHIYRSARCLHMSTGLCELDFHNVATSQAVKLRICQTWFISLSAKVCINIMSVFHNCKQSVGVCVCVCVHVCVCVCVCVCITSTVMCRGSTICQIMRDMMSMTSRTPTVAYSFQGSKC